MIGHLHYIMSSKYELFLFILLSVALVIINYLAKKYIYKRISFPFVRRNVLTSHLVNDKIIELKG